MSELDAIKQILKRERSARKEAERIMEEKSLELFEINQKLVQLNTSLEKEVEERVTDIKRNEEQLRILFENHPFPMLVYEIDTFRIVAVNQTAIDNYGYSKADFFGMTIKDLHFGNDDNLDKHLKDVKSGIFRIRTWQHRTKLGEIIDVEISATTIEYEEKPARLVLIKDVTTQKKIESEKRLNEKRYQDLVETVSDIIYRCDSKGHFLYVNPTAIHVCGYSGEELVGKHFSEIIREDYRKKVLFFYLEQLTSGVLSTYLEFPVITKSGNEIWIGQTVDTYHLDDDIEFIALARDITDRKKIETELIEAKDLAEESVRSKELFMANMSHEIRTPMNAIIGMGELLHRTTLNLRQQQYVDAIKTSANNLLIIINDILDFSKIESGKLSLEEVPVHLPTLFENVRKTVELKIEEKGLELEFDVDPRIATYLADPTRLSQVFTNLMGNAVKFTETGGIKVKCGVMKSYSDRDLLIFSVKDTGIGIQPSKQRHIFESFKQADESTTRKYGGTGLGLAITKQLLELMGSELKLVSARGIGSDFYFSVEFKKIKARPEVREKEELDQELIKGMSVLLVEDHEINRFMAQTILENWECKIDIAINGKEAVTAVRNNNYDVVLMDMRMPEMNGIDATRIIRTNLKSDVPIIALTANAIKGDSERCIEAGMNDYISKPFKQDELLAKLIKYKSNGKSDRINVENTTSEEAITDTTSLMDLTVLIQSTNNNSEFMKKMIHLFLDDTPEQLRKMKAALDESNLESVSKIAHRLKPSIDHLAIKKLRSLVRKIEDYQSYPSTDLVVTSVNKFTLLVQRLMEELENEVK